ncbi:MAG: hypothetical protein P8L85_15535 [Rubripirellula sp.]|nr:hypothetical protein [Rubripirellula sp.]
MSWVKLGQIYQPGLTGRHDKLLTHASNPLPLHLEGNVYRCFFSGRDSDNRSSVGAVDIDIESRLVVREHQQPFFQHGSAGSFYEDGVSIGGCYTAAGVRYMLFMGWRNPEGEHWRGEIGRLIVQPNLTLEIDKHEPFLGINEHDPISLSYPWVHKNAAGGFQMWYGSTRTWDAGNDEMIHTIEYATSLDGQKWDRLSQTVPFEVGVAQAFSRPTVLHDPEQGYEMWFSFRCGTGRTYRIGYTQSQDGENWALRPAELGLSVSQEGWDSEMVEYPYVLKHQGTTYMFYNGNGYGRSGIGLAVREQAT